MDQKATVSKEVYSPLHPDKGSGSAVFTPTYRCAGVHLLHRFNADNSGKFLQDLIANLIKKWATSHHQPRLAGSHI